MVVVNDKANGNPHVGAGSHARPREGVCQNIGDGHARPVAQSPHAAAKADTSVKDALPHGRPTRRPHDG